MWGGVGAMGEAVVVAGVAVTVVKQEVRISNQVRIQARVTKVVKSLNQAVAMAAKKAVTIVVAVEMESKITLLPELVF